MRVMLSEDGKLRCIRINRIACVIKDGEECLELSKNGKKIYVDTLTVDPNIPVCNFIKEVLNNAKFDLSKYPV